MQLFILISGLILAIVMVIQKKYVGIIIGLYWLVEVFLREILFSTSMWLYYLSSLLLCCSLLVMGINNAKGLKND